MQNVANVADAIVLQESGPRPYDQAAASPLAMNK